MGSCGTKIQPEQKPTLSTNNSPIQKKKKEKHASIKPSKPEPKSLISDESSDDLFITPQQQINVTPDHRSHIKSNQKPKHIPKSPPKDITNSAINTNALSTKSPIIKKSNNKYDQTNDIKSVNNVPTKLKQKDFTQINKQVTPQAINLVESDSDSNTSDEPKPTPLAIKSDQIQINIPTDDYKVSSAIKTPNIEIVDSNNDQYDKDDIDNKQISNVDVDNKDDAIQDVDDIDKTMKDVIKSNEIDKARNEAVKQNELLKQKNDNKAKEEYDKLLNGAQIEYDKELKIIKIEFDKDVIEINNEAIEKLKTITNIKQDTQDQIQINPDDKMIDISTDDDYKMSLAIKTANTDINDNNDNNDNNKDNNDNDDNDNNDNIKLLNGAINEATKIVNNRMNDHYDDDDYVDDDNIANLKDIENKEDQENREYSSTLNPSLSRADSISIDFKNVSQVTSIELAIFVEENMNMATLTRVWKHLDPDGSGEIDCDEVVIALTFMAVLLIAYKFQNNADGGQPTMDKKDLERQVKPIGDWILKEKMHQDDVVNKKEFKDKFTSWLQEYHTAHS